MRSNIMIVALRLIVTSLTPFILSSCTRRLTDKDFRWIPYNGNETLVFNSSSGDADTIFLTGKDRHLSPSDPLDVFPIKLEHFTVMSKHTDPVYGGRYIEGAFLELSTSEEKTTYLSLHLTAKDAWFYGGSFMELKALDDISFISLQTKLRTYNDIIQFVPESNEYAGRSNFISRVYWSKSEGLVRYDKRDGVYWELAKKYNP